MEPPLGPPPPSTHVAEPAPPASHALSSVAGVAVHGRTAPSTPVPRKTRAKKKTGVLQPPRTSVQSAAAPNMSSSGRAAEADGTVGDDQQMLEELPPRVVVTQFWIPRHSMTFSSLDEAC
ncbi:unnamed protein product [Urochloa humidicola]